MPTYSNRLPPAVQNLLHILRFFLPRSSCTTMHILADVQRMKLNASCMTISGGRTKQLDIFCLIAGLTSDFLSFIVLELIRFFHGAIQLSVTFTSCCCMFLCGILCESVVCMWKDNVVCWSIMLYIFLVYCRIQIILFLWWMLQLGKVARNR